ncbi:MAG: hypothetical protein P8Y98_05900 [Anaerolineales bacterium]
MSMKHIPPGLTLLLLAPILGELVSRHQTPLAFIQPLNFLLLSLPYGLGALVCRELTVRWHKGGFSLLLLGAAYGIYEEGVVVRSLFNPRWDELGALAQYNHVAGVNWTWSMMVIHFHTLISIGASVMLAEILYAGWYILAWMAVFALAWMAHRLPALPRSQFRRTVPHPLAFFLLGLVNMTIFFFTIFLTAEAAKPPLVVTMMFLVLLDAATLWLTMRWSNYGADWDDRHRLALIAGFLGFFIYFSVDQDLADWQGSSVVAMATVLALWRLRRDVAARLNSKGIDKPQPEAV